MMSKEFFEKFKKVYLKRFRKYYQESETARQRKILKKDIFDSPKLSEIEKKEFWELVQEK